ncbi:chorismate mutase [Shewanella putrefaciens]|uniref:Chorismate mutase n=1 Tax=Shewanella putrefaciens TaxID=24 RepID=A0ABX8XED8_SHEPU|nr:MULTISPECIES: chorismate mutase [Shewanella]ABM25804.1 prephenate dehydratase / chorismate mutase [Shewanella sp. W3-18-1]AVV83256.1 chorismate mutase chorismate mutase [Shewanella putrefaciens]MCT8942506.1 chorismate mutase [Shewanella putrefaciens]QSE50462.1 chorismate mutase [Shewanella putrefaciens]QYX73872.1 chorismate mutase [Shewanella putrefaciens]
MHKPQPLNQTREQITHLDNELLSLLAERRRLSLEVARSKEVDVRPIRDTQREKELLARLVKAGREKGLDAHYVISLYQSIIEDSVLNQQAYLHGRANPETQKQQYCIAYLGARGSYSYLAATRYCQRRQVDMLDLGCQSFDEIVQAVESGHADYGFLPIENTSSGSINEVYDVLQHTSLSIVGETTIEVSHCLLAKAGSKISDIKTVYAHPQPISQCSRYLSQHKDLRLEYCSSSAEAMERVNQSPDNSAAAIGSVEGGALYQLESIEAGLANQKINQSRFIVVARKAVAVPEQLPAKTTLIMATGQKAGALVEALLVLKAHQLNMSKLESRPIPGTPWEEMFYLDIDANISSEAMQAGLKQLERITRFIKVLGCYPCETVKPTQLSNSQLLIEPSTSKTQVISDTVPDANPFRYSKAYKAQASEINCGPFCIGAGNIGAIAKIVLTHEQSHLALTQFEHKIKQLKEAGFQAVILDNINQLVSPELILPKLRQTLHQYDLLCIIAIEQAIDIVLATQQGDMLFLTGKHMFNQSLLTQAGTLPIPLLLERNDMASYEEFLAATEVILSQGNQQLILCDSGVRTFNNANLPTLDLTSLIQIKATSHLPIVINPCYAIADEALILQTKGIKQLKADGLVLNCNLNDNDSLKLMSSVVRELYN